MVIIMGDTIYCPLCEEKMIQREIRYYNKECKLYFCKPCDIGIYDFDPALNKWRDGDKKIPCPNCGHPEMKWFVRFMDGFFKARCPKCGVILKKDGDVKFVGNDMDNAIILPEDMEQEPIEEAVEVQIPIAHLEKRLGKDKADALRKKIQRKKKC